jgi:hypothetical protein
VDGSREMGQGSARPVDRVAVVLLATFMPAALFGCLARRVSDICLWGCPTCFDAGVDHPRTGWIIEGVMVTMKTTTKMTNMMMMTMKGKKQNPRTCRHSK